MKTLATLLRRAVLLAALPGAALAQSSAPAPLLAANGTPYFIRLPEAGSAAARALPTDGAALLRQHLGLSPADEMRPLRLETDELGQRHEVYQQYFHGLKVEHGRYTVHSRQGRPELLTGEVKRTTNVATTPVFGAAAARQRAEAAVGARRYMWQDAQAEQQLKALTGNASATYFPSGELVLVEDFRQPAAARPLVLAWKFDIYAQQPMSRAEVYVDARTGEVVLQNATIKHATGPAATRFSGTQTITTEPLSGPATGYRLAQATRSRNGQNGNGIQTYNSGGSSTFAPYDFVDNDNNWTAAEYDNSAKDNAALDAHWGAEVTYDYWADVHQRNSYDNAGSRLISFVHYDSSPGDGVGMNNAFWNGSLMAYGDGSNLQPFTVLDVCGHEIGHAVCQSTVNLVYQNESGALNEGFSDIWGACIERYAVARFGPLPGKSTWLVGEELSSAGTGLRSMSNPNAGGLPDTYGGSYWVTGTYDNGGVHYNSGVLSYWFYLLNEGGSGTNDLGFVFNVTGISPSGNPATINDAARIAFRAENLYLTGNATFAQARVATLQAAADLFGAGSAQVVQVGNAWDAVGVRDASVALSITAFSPTQAAGSSAATITLTGTNFTGVTSVSFNGTNAPGFTIVNSTTLTVPLPVGASTGKIVVSKPGFRASSATDFVVNTGPQVTSISPSSGGVGQVLTITGQNFEAGATVRVGGVPATSVTFNSATQLTATVALTTPAGAQPVVVTTSPGDSNPTVLYTLVMPAPTLTSFTPASGPPVGGGTMLITGTDFGSSPITVTVAGQPAPQATVVSTTQLRVTLPAAAAGTTGPVVVTTPGGTSTSAGSYTYLDVLNLANFSPVAAQAGSTVTVYGAQLANTTSVLLNGVAASITGRTASSVSFVVPDGAPATGITTVATPSGSTTSPDFRVLLRLLSRSPASNGRNAPRTNSGVQLTFSEPVTTASLASARVFSSQRGGRKTGAWSNSGTSFSFAATAATPQTDFLPGETVRVSVPATVQSAGGVALPAQVYQFSTATAGTGRGNLTLSSTLTSDGNSVTTNVGDIDGDGDLDLVMVSAGAPSIQTLLNGGDRTGSNTGLFSNGSRWTTSVRLNGSTLGDVDGDGDLDLLATTSYPNDLRVYVNNGEGVFTAGNVLATTFRTYDLSVGDLDGDGDLDVVTNNSDYNQLTICLNNGNGTFRNGGNVLTGTSPGNIAIGDVDGDGDLDLACGLQNNGSPQYAVAIHLNGGDNTGLNQGTFPTRQIVPVQAANCRAMLGDVDGDGDLDLLALGVTGGRASLRLNGGDNTGSNTGNFLNGGNLVLPAAAANYWSGSLGDMDADGDLDLVLPSIASRSVYVVRNDGNGTFGSTVSYPFLTTFEPYFAALGDVDGDGDLDVVATDINRAPVNILLNEPFKPLPVELTAFAAAPAGPAAVRLTWTTASERNSARFEVQRSSDGETFAPIGSVAAQGTSTSATRYSFLDERLPAALSQQLIYYRLRQLDVDGTGSYSPVRPVALGPAAARLTLTPNPAHNGTATLRGSTPGAAVQVYDARGRLVTTTTADAAGAAVLQLPTGLPGGVYIVRAGSQSLRLLVE